MARRSSRVEKNKVSRSEATEPSLQPIVTDPPKLFILPKDASNARVVSLLDPSSDVPRRYLFIAEKGVYEFTKIQAPNGSPKSWLVGPCKKLEGGNLESTQNNVLPELVSDEVSEARDGKEMQRISKPRAIAAGYAMKDAALFIATPLDPLFLMLPVLVPMDTTAKDGKRLLFLSADDHFDALIASSRHYKYILKNDRFRRRCESRLEAICDVVNAGEEKMYRFSRQKLAKVVYVKAQRMSADGLPESMERHFVSKVLEMPAMSVRTLAAAGTEEMGTAPADTNETIHVLDAKSDAMELTDSEHTIDSMAGASATRFLTTTLMPDVQISETPAMSKIVQLLRLRTAINYLLSSYISPTIEEELQTVLFGEIYIDFSPLDDHLAHLASEKAKHLALRTMSDNISRKRGFAEDDEAAEVRAEKKRKKEEEEKNKKSESRGVRDLKKADTSGMKKLNSFFAKQSAKS